MHGRGRFLLAVAGILSLAWAHSRVATVRLMSETANNFLASLSADQAAKATFSMDDEERFFWHFIPTADVARRYGRPRRGLRLREMSPEQKHLAGALLSAGLSRDGYIKARTIMSLEEVLRLLEGDSGERRDPESYHFSIFGRPSERGVWGYRMEGHHVSLHYTVVNGKLAASPSFFGANPAEVKQGPRKGLRALAREEDLARDLLAALDAEQRRTAIVSEQAYPDILTSAHRKAALEGQPSGLAAARMTPRQQELLAALVAEYAANMPPEIAEYRLEQFRRAGDRVFFAWAGAIERGGPHYYRVQAPEFLIEYDCTQNNANHIHSVWRDYDGDFGQDLLKEHYRSSHQ